MVKKLIPTQHLRGCWDITFPAIIMSSFFLERYWKTTDSPFKALTFRLVSRSPNNVCVCDNCRKLIFRFNSFRLFFKLDSVVKQPRFWEEPLSCNCYLMRPQNKNLMPSLKKSQKTVDTVEKRGFSNFFKIILVLILRYWVFLK